MLTVQYDNGWWGFILGAGYFNDQYGSLHVTGSDGTVTTTLSGSEQSAGSGLGTAGIMLGCMVGTAEPVEGSELMVRLPPRSTSGTAERRASSCSPFSA